MKRPVKLPQSRSRLNGLATLAQSREVWWSSDHQTLGVDKVYNDIKVTFSPYGDGALMTDEDIKFGEEVDEEETNYNHSTSTATKFSYFPDLSTDWSWNGMSGLQWPVFTIHLGDGALPAQPAYSQTKLSHSVFSLKE